jgi:chloramphenicol-sensitive protein RarD
MKNSDSAFKSGVLAAATAYFCWGLWPIFWKQLDGIDALELIADRIVWSEIAILPILVYLGQTSFWRGVQRRTALMLGASAGLIALNWWVYVWAVGEGRIVESSLGYFINPLVNVLFGVVFLRERLNRAQWSAVVIAACGVVYLTIGMGAPPWIAITLALTFGGYGLIRKLAPIDAPRGLALEGAWLFVPALLYLLVLHGRGENHFGTVSSRIDFLIVLTGPVSAIPLLLFSYGARRIPLSLLGILQYIGPTMQFLSGVLIYGEPFSRVQLVGFGLTWTALAIYAADGFWRQVRQRVPADEAT